MSRSATVAGLLRMNQQSQRRFLVMAVIVLIAFRVVVLFIGLRIGQSVDIQRFFVIAHSPGRPYVDYAVEYPPVLVAVLKLAAFATPDERAFTVTVIVMSLVAEAAIVFLLWRSWSATAALWFLAVDVPLLALFIVRLDLLSVALVIAAVASARRSHAVLAALCIVVAVGLKLWPAPLALVLLPLLPAGARRGYIVAGLCGLFALLTAWLAVGGVAGIEQVLTFRGAAGWQIESLGGSFVRLFTGEPALVQSGAHRVGHVPAALAMLLPLTALASSVWICARVRSWGDVGVAWIACVGVFLLTSSVYSPQFTSWLVPGGAIAFFSGDLLASGAIAAVVLGTFFENAFYQDLVAGTPEAMAFVAVRNLALVAAVIFSARALALRRRGWQPPPGGFLARLGRVLPAGDGQSRQEEALQRS